MAVVILGALRHALDSAREDSGLNIDDDFYHLGAPSTPETIFMLANNIIDDFKLK